MSLAEFLKQVKPDLTLCGVLITVAVGAFWFWRFFWDYEQKLRSDQIDRLRDLIQNFRDRIIDPILRVHLDTFGTEICTKVVANLANDLYTENLVAGGPRTKELKAPEALADLLGEAALTERSQRERDAATIAVRDLLESDRGDRLFNELDRGYNHVGGMARRYRWACFWCAATGHGCLMLGILSLVGLLQALGAWRDLLWYFWLFALTESGAISLVSFILMEFYRRRLLSMWEELQLVGAPQ
jgi:hypothetical protein